MFASSLTRLTVTPGCAFSNSLINLSVNRLLRKLGTATVSCTLLSVADRPLPAGAWVGDVLLIEPVGADEHAHNIAPATTITTINGKRLTLIQVLPQLHAS